MEDSPEETSENTSARAGETSWEAEVGRLEIVEADRVRVWRDAFRRLCVQVNGGEEMVDVRPAQVFPVSGAAEYVAFLDSDDKEVLLLRDMRRLDAESRQCLEQELGRVYFVPKIVSVYNIEDAHGAARWEVETDRGYRLFDVRDREDVRVLEGRRVLLQDADGNRYEIDDVFELDERSRRLVDGEI